MLWVSALSPRCPQSRWEAGEDAGNCDLTGLRLKVVELGWGVDSAPLGKLQAGPLLREV